MSIIEKVQPIHLTVPVTTDTSTVEGMVAKLLGKFADVEEQIRKQVDASMLADAKIVALGDKQAELNQSLAAQQSALARIEHAVGSLATAVRGLHYAIDQIGKAVSPAADATPRPGPSDAGPGDPGAGNYPGGRGPDEPAASHGPTQEPPSPPTSSAGGWGRPFRVVSGLLVFVAIAVAAYGAFAKL